MTTTAARPNRISILMMVVATTFLVSCGQASSSRPATTASSEAATHFVAVVQMDSSTLEQAAEYPNVCDLTLDTREEMIATHYANPPTHQETVVNCTKLRGVLKQAIDKYESDLTSVSTPSRFEPTAKELKRRLVELQTVVGADLTALAGDDMATHRDLHSRIGDLVGGIILSAGSVSA